MKKGFIKLLMPILLLCFVFVINVTDVLATTAEEATTAAEATETEETTTEAAAETATVTIKLNKKTAQLHTKTKKTIKLKATVKGSKKTVKWTSSNKSVATVNRKGKVTAKKAGTTTIKATVAGVTAKCKITVKAPATGRTGTYEKDFGGCVREVTIKQISATKIKFQVRFTSMMKICTSNAITAKVDGKTVKFSYQDLGFGGTGTGKMTLNKNWVKIKLTNTNGQEDYLQTGGKTFKLKRKNSKKTFYFY